ncbi:hypothetical protein H257_13610 [Aphanomyces astaci]|uniref:U2A'/phosphoprotein 32 family A C-terminal domain-containing protein n=1 Tax=Aphanomyces astaci TaxID=112090 RepID=W4FTH9_APHAT|nr:hypothetical protein H257_13610 [Aphanomyces astaci]ETV70820.1 hypothetical protein H257_13610 [Aphanomyces astaci]|eukprot:XP_009839483.1 hypothetical protein H257_13610 [Aphanomyces astaci]
MTQLERSVVRENLSLLGKHPITNKHIFTRLDVKKHNLTAVDVLKDFPYLQDVDVANNQIESLAALAHLPFLISLNAENNHLTTLLDFDPPQCTAKNAWVDGQEAIGPMLHIANFARNSISVMRDLKTHRYIQELILDHNHITEITGISELVFLKYFSISHNKLKTTRGLTENMPIEILNLSHNELVESSQLPKLTRLLIVNVAHNKLRSLEDFGKCRMLQKLDVSFNRIKDLHHVDALTKLRDLSSLNLAQCPITRIPFYRFRILVRTQQVVKLDGFPASIKERIKAKVIHGDDIQARTDIFDCHLKGLDKFVNYLPPLEYALTNSERQLSSPTLKPAKITKADSCKNVAKLQASKAILIAQVKIVTETFTRDTLNDLPKRYPMLFGKSGRRKPSRRSNGSIVSRKPILVQPDASQ